MNLYTYKSKTYYYNLPILKEVSLHRVGLFSGYINNNDGFIREGFKTITIFE